jgi:hypothetical protein
VVFIPDRPCFRHAPASTQLGSFDSVRFVGIEEAVHRLCRELLKAIGSRMSAQESAAEVPGSPAYFRLGSACVAAHLGELVSFGAQALRGTLRSEDGDKDGKLSGLERQSGSAAILPGYLHHLP